MSDMGVREDKLLIALRSIDLATAKDVIRDQNRRIVELERRPKITMAVESRGGNEFDYVPFDDAIKLDRFAALHLAKSQADVAMQTARAEVELIGRAVVAWPEALPSPVSVAEPVRGGDIHFPAWSGGVPGGEWIYATDCANACCGSHGGIKFTKEIDEVTCFCCRDVIKSHPAAPVGFDPWKEET